MQIDTLTLQYRLPQDAQRSLSLRRTSKGAELLFSSAQPVALSAGQADALFERLQAFPLARWCESYSAPLSPEKGEGSFSLWLCGELYSFGRDAFPRDFVAFLQLFLPFGAVLPDDFILLAKTEFAYPGSLLAYLTSGAKEMPRRLRRGLVFDVGAGELSFSGKRYPCDFFRMQALVSTLRQFCAQDAFTPRTEQQRLFCTTVELTTANGSRQIFALPPDQSAERRTRILAPQLAPLLHRRPLYSAVLPLQGERVYRCLRVEFEPRAPKSYLYLENGLGAKPGEFAVVAVSGSGTKERIVRVIATEDYPQRALPLPPEKLRSVLRLCENPQTAVRNCPVTGEKTPPEDCLLLQRRLFDFSRSIGEENPYLSEQRMLCDRCCFHRDLPPF